ncbi:branched-chain amino acid ABC transporter permease [Aquibium sp. ELW1220]|jgi:branched-chain amino acid transport system permease protein|uniref:branched-chain amino acid ABC transporter permease n=1 Tax=Aquibium sp. ELW1220 TaxID=2976766 RepID=UPI0025B0D357|nr:branched-chain amino acid ABC transporter permease [Aquibium sp. ELW1220]MDN2583504.1 branched-chain amino acid ABC transporter permease [Aquibium sp. ELW1220]
MTIARVRPAIFFSLLALLVAGALIVPHVANRGVVFLSGVVAINVVFGIAFNLAFAKAGILSFGNAMFFAVGAYCAGYLITQQNHLPFVVILLAAAGCGGLLALVTGLLALRRASGVYFAVITLAVGALVHVLIMKLNFLGRNDGLVGVNRPIIDLGLVELDLARGDAYYYFIIASCALLVTLMWVLWSNRFGRSLQGVKSDPMRASFLGIDIDRKRLIALVLSGSITALAGAIYAPWAQIVTPELAHWSFSTMPLLFTLLGGSAFFLGPAVGAILFGLLDYATRSLIGISDLLVGGLLLAVVLSVPGGVLGLLGSLLARVRAPSSPRREGRA